MPPLCCVERKPAIFLLFLFFRTPATGGSPGPPGRGPLSPPAGGDLENNASRDPGEGALHAATTGADQETTQRNASRSNQGKGPRQPLGARV